MQGAGAHYDFARPSQHNWTGREICLRDAKLTCYYGFLLEMGDRSPTEIANLSEAPPPWADETITRRWSDFWVPSEKLPPDLAASLGQSKQRGGPGGVRAQAWTTYLFGSIDDAIKSDILVGLRVLRICDDDSALMAYRILKEFEHPGRR